MKMNRMEANVDDGVESLSNCVARPLILSVSSILVFLPLPLYFECFFASYPRRSFLITISIVRKLRVLDIFCCLVDEDISSSAQPHVSCTSTLLAYCNYFVISYLLSFHFYACCSYIAAILDFVAFQAVESELCLRDDTPRRLRAAQHHSMHFKNIGFDMK